MFLILWLMTMNSISALSHNSVYLTSSYLNMPSLMCVR